MEGSEKTKYIEIIDNLVKKDKENEIKIKQLEDKIKILESKLDNYDKIIDEKINQKMGLIKLNPKGSQNLNQNMNNSNAEMDQPFQDLLDLPDSMDNPNKKDMQNLPKSQNNEKIRVYFQRSDEKGLISMLCSKGEKISSVIERYRKKIKAPEDEIKLIFKGQVLRTDATVSESNIDNEDKIVAIVEISLMG